MKKKIDVTPEAVDVIMGMVWGEQDGNVTGKITQQLDRPLYVKVNNALEALGGKWNRKAQTHLFPSDPRLELVEMQENGCLVVDDFNFFPTPPDIIEQMIELTDLKPYSLIILEPSAGDGRIADALRDQGEQHAIYCCEIAPKLRDILEGKGHRLVGTDFLEYELPRHEDGDLMFEYDRIVMNPPFARSQDINHVRHAFDLLKPGGTLVSIMGEGAFFRGDRKATDFRDWLVGLDSWAKRLPIGTFKESGTMVSTRIVVIHK